MSDATAIDRPKASSRPPRYSEARPRTRVRAGKRALPTAHSQSIWARLFCDVQGAVVQQRRAVSETQRLAVRRIAALEVELIHLEDAFVIARTDGRTSEPADLTLYATMANAQRRFCEALGCHRTLRDVTPSLGQFLADIEARKATETTPGESGEAASESKTSERPREFSNGPKRTSEPPTAQSKGA